MRIHIITTRIPILRRDDVIVRWCGTGVTFTHTRAHTRDIGGTT